MSDRLPGPLVSADWLAAHLDEVRVVDVRWYLDGRSGRAAYDSGHIAGAVWADIDDDLAGPPTPEGGRHPLPTPEHFAAAMERLGIGNGDAVVAYDDASGSIAARLWWMLRSLGVEAAVLDGGLQAWTRAAHDRGAGAAHRTLRAAALARRRVRRHRARRRAARRRPGAAGRRPRRRPLPRRGHGRSRSPGAGHIPGGRSAPWTDNVDADDRAPAPAGRAARALRRPRRRRGGRRGRVLRLRRHRVPRPAGAQVAGFEHAGALSRLVVGVVRRPDRPAATGEA